MLTKRRFLNIPLAMFSDRRRVLTQSRRHRIALERLTEMEAGRTTKSVGLLFAGDELIEIHQNSRYGRPRRHFRCICFVRKRVGREVSG